MIVYFLRTRGSVLDTFDWTSSYEIKAESGKGKDLNNRSEPLAIEDASYQFP